MNPQKIRDVIDKYKISDSGLITITHTNNQEVPWIIAYEIKPHVGSSQVFISYNSRLQTLKIKTLLDCLKAEYVIPKLALIKQRNKNITVESVDTQAIQSIYLIENIGVSSFKAPFIGNIISSELAAKLIRCKEEGINLCNQFDILNSQITVNKINNLEDVYENKDFEETEDDFI